MSKIEGSDSKADYRPSPADFDLYLPWACTQLQLEYSVQVIRVYQNEYSSAMTTDRSKKGKSRVKLDNSPTNGTTDQEKEKDASETLLNQVHSTNIIKIMTMYDSYENLVNIKFENNKQLPRIIMKVVGLIIQFHSHLRTITINSGLDQYIIYEICKFLPVSQITELCLDGCYLKEPNFHLLLERANLLKYLSLCRCKIDDKTVEFLCSMLIYPMPASKTLCILNLSSNRITDEGAQLIADVLRSNRQISYLNLASNMITDQGANAILDILMEFPVTAEEDFISKGRQTTYLQNKYDMLAATIRDLRLEDVDKKILKRKSIRTAKPGLRKTKQDTPSKSLFETYKSLADLDNALVDKAMAVVNTAFGDFVDPLSRFNTFMRNGVKYCIGNNYLCWLNISYNNLSYLILRKIQTVLSYQKLANRMPRGLLSVSVEGNHVPIACRELSQIDNILEINLTTQTRKLSASKKRTNPKTVR